MYWKNHHLDGTYYKYKIIEDLKQYMGCGPTRIFDAIMSIGFELKIN